MITLAKKHTKSKWIEVDNIKLLIDYPTQEQELELRDIPLLNIEIEGGQEKKLSVQAKQVRYARLYLKYTIKDWEGLEIECKVVNDELEDSLWMDLITKNPDDVIITIWAKVFEELSFNEVDKKKS